MKYFIDFEATQFTNEIISIGCVAENGETFYSLVKPAKLDKITSFITNLTGITKDLITEAPTSDDVFNSFYDWLKEDEQAIFYCYGNSDLDFIKKNLSKTKNLKAQAALSLIGMNLHDLQETVKIHFGTKDCIGLARLVAFYRGVEKIEQSHNALEDAFYLKEIYENLNKESTYKICPLILNVIGEPKIIRVERWSKEGTLNKIYSNLGEAIEDCFKEINNINTKKSKIRKKIERSSQGLSVNGGTSAYLNSNWKIVYRNKGEKE